MEAAFKGDAGGLLGAVGVGGPWVAAATAALGGLVAAGYAVKTALDLAGEAEKNRLAFEAMLGSADKAGKVLGKLRQYVEESPFNTAQVLDIGKGLLAFGIEGDQITPSVRALGDIAAVTGGDLGLLALAFWQVKMQGRLAGQELNQFANQGVPLIEYLAAVMDKPHEEIKKLVEQGEVGFDTVVEAINHLTQSGGKFFGLADKYSKSFSGLLDQVGDKGQTTFDGVNQAGAGGFLLDATRTVRRPEGVGTTPSTTPSGTPTAPCTASARRCSNWGGHLRDLPGERPRPPPGRVRAGQR